MSTIYVVEWRQNMLGAARASRTLIDQTGALALIDSFPFEEKAKELEELGREPLPMLYFETSSDDFCTATFGPDGICQFYMYYHCINWHSGDLPQTALRNFVSRYFAENHRLFFRSVAKSGEGFTIIGSTFRAKVTRLMVGL